MAWIRGEFVIRFWFLSSSKKLEHRVSGQEAWFEGGKGVSDGGRIAAGTIRNSTRKLPLNGQGTRSIRPEPTGTLVWGQARRLLLLQNLCKPA